MFPAPEIPGQVPPAPVAPRVPHGTPKNNLVNWPTSSGPYPPPDPPCSSPGSPLIRLPTKTFQLPAKPRKRDVAGIAGLPPLLEIFLWRLGCRWWERPFVRIGWCRWQTASQPTANWILFEAFCKKVGAGQLQCFQQLEERMSAWVCREEALVHYPGAEPFETPLWWTPSMRDGSCRCFSDIRELAAIG